MPVFKAIAALAFIALLSGCASLPPPYVEPAGGATATITFIDRTDGANLGVVRLPGDLAGCACSATEPQMIGIFHNMAVLVPGSAGYADKGKKTDRFTVAAAADGSEFRFLMGVPKYNINTDYVAKNGVPGRTIQSVYCQAHHGFRPERGARYEVIYDETRSPCAMEIYRIDQGGRVRVAAKDYPRCALRNDNGDGVSDKIRAYCQANPDLYRRK